MGTVVVVAMVALGHAGGHANAAVEGLLARETGGIPPALVAIRTFERGITINILDRHTDSIALAAAISVYNLCRANQFFRHIAGRCRDIDQELAFAVAKPGRNFFAGLGPDLDQAETPQGPHLECANEKRIIREDGLMAAGHISDYKVEFDQLASLYVALLAHQILRRLLESRSQD